jgi:hypothetical protein
MNEPYLLRVYEKWRERQTQKKERKEKNKERKEARRKTQPMAKTCPVKQRAGQLFSRIESEKVFVNLPPLVRGVG